MIDFLKKLFEDEPDPAALARDKHLAAAALMVEAAVQDADFAPAERAKILDLLRRHFGLSAWEAGQLLADAEKLHGDSNQLLRFTRTLKDHCSPDERIAIMDMLWEVVLADGRVDSYEDNLMRRIGGLLYVTDQDRGTSRKRVAARLGLAL